MPEPAASPPDTEMRAHVERALGAHYELDQEIGRGGMGIVYRGRDRRLKRTVAIKVLPPELAFRSEIKSRFLREAETAAQLNHPNIVDIYAVDEAEGLVFFVMAYIAGDNLAKRLHERGVFSPEETRRIMCEVADALAYAHERGVIHRDIKPDNILLDSESGRPMVTDFGIARATEGGDSRLTATGMAIGTPAYMSPEQAAGEREIDGRSDLYALGIVAYQMLAGEPPFSAASTPAMLVKHLSERPTPVEQRRSDTPQDLARAIMLCLEKDPANRFPNAMALKVALEGDSSAFGARRSAWPEAEPALSPASEPSWDVGREVATRSTSPLYADARTPNAEPLYNPTAADIRRWEAGPVQQFRRKLAPYLFVNGVIVIASLFSDSDFFTITVLWSIYIAYKYARLWTEGYDWRDVFRQPRDRELLDVADDLVEYVRALFSSEKRRQLRERRRERQLGGAARASALAGGRQTGPLVTPGRATTGAMSTLRTNGMAATAAGAADRRADVRSSRRVQEAHLNRDRILQLLGELPKAERERLSDVARSAVALSDRIEGLSVALAEIDRHSDAGSARAIEAEIARLEQAADPTDERASEERARRLFPLRRQLRALGDLTRKREAIVAKIDTCAIALDNMKLDLLRLRAGDETQQRVTELAVRALSLAENVDSALYVADEMRRLDADRASDRGTGARR